MLSDIDKNATHVININRLNPCSNGICSLTKRFDDYNREYKVS